LSFEGICRYDDPKLNISSDIYVLNYECRIQEYGSTRMNTLGDKMDEGLLAANSEKRP